MNRIVRRRLEMVKRVRDFMRAHPSQDGSFTLVLAQLEEKVVRLEDLSKQEEGGHVNSHASSIQRQKLRRRLHHEMIRHLVTVADLAALENPDLVDRFVMPKGGWTNERFRAFVRKLLEEGQAQKDLLARHGLADKLLDDITTAVSEFDASVAESNQARRDHVGARAELKAVSDETVRLVEMLDGFNRYRFGGNAELRAAWDSARNVVSGPRPKQDPAEGEPGGGPSPAEPPSDGGVRPAA